MPIALFFLAFGETALCPTVLPVHMKHALGARVPGYTHKLCCHLVFNHGFILLKLTTRTRGLSWVIPDSRATAA